MQYDQPAFPPLLHREMARERENLSQSQYQTNWNVPVSASRSVSSHASRELIDCARCTSLGFNEIGKRTLHLVIETKQSHVYIMHWV